MVEGTERGQDLPLVPTLLCLFGANWAGGLAGEILGGGPIAVAMAQARASYATLVVVQVAAALVGAVVVRYLLRTIVGCEVTLGGAVAALLAGALVTLCGEVVFAAAQRGGHDLNSTAALPLLFVLGPIATLLSYLVLQYTFQSPAGSPSPYVSAYADAVTDSELASYDECVDAVRETSAGLVDSATRARLDEVADIVVNGLPYLDAATNALRRAAPPANVPPRLHQDLVDGAQTVHDELLAAGRRAALGDDPRLQLADSAGMREVRRALHELAELGIACDW